MHPEIKKFWENSGHELVGPSFIETWEILIGDGCIRRIETVCHGDSYRYNEKWYSEEEMLRIIRLKAFL